MTTVPRVWTLLFAAQVRRRPADALPEDWIDECRRLVRAAPREGTLRDAVSPAEDASVSHAIAKVVDRVKARVFPIHGIS